MVDNISMIVAMSANRVIGANNKLLWYIPEDLKRFKTVTMGCPIVMGKNTFFSLPNGALPGRENIVLSSSLTTEAYPNITIIRDVDSVLKHCEGYKECFIIGGEQVYRTFLPYTKKLYLTKLEKEYQGDAFFPAINDAEWEIIEQQQNKKQDLSFMFITLLKKNG